MTDIAHEPQPCLGCGKFVDAATGVFGARTPESGDVTVCLYCGHLMVFREFRGRLQLLDNPTDKESHAIAGAIITEMKARQTAKIRELGHALVDAGFFTLDEQSKALGLARSTTWTILSASHKGSGLSAGIIKRMLLSPQLPPLARRKILEYTTDKLAGAYGGSTRQRRTFFERVRRATPEEL